MNFPKLKVSFILRGDMSFIYNMSGWVYGFHMLLFFMLSGAVLALKPLKDFDTFFRSKVKRLLIPYFIYGCFFMLPAKYMANFYSADSFKRALYGFLLGQDGDSGHLWFLIALFWCMIAFVILQKRLLITSKSIYASLLLTGVITLTYDYIPFDLFGLKKGLSYMF